jgi:hypothetical protein
MTRDGATDLNLLLFILMLQKEQKENTSLKELAITIQPSLSDAL